MSIFYQFKVEIVDSNAPNANVLAELGQGLISAIPTVRKATSNTSSPNNPAANWIETYIESYLDIATIVYQNILDANADSVFNSYGGYSPLAYRFDSNVFPAGSYLRLKNESGYYMVNGSPFGTQPIVAGGNFNAYRPDGTLIGSVAIYYSISGSNANITGSFLSVDIDANNQVMAVNNRINIYSTSSATQYNIYTITSSVNNNTVEFLSHLKEYVSSFDPYDGAGDSEEGGGDGTFDYSGSPPGGFDDFSFPTISAVDTGFVTLYNPTPAELKQLSNYLWSSSFDLDTFKKIFNDPMELFLGLSIVPVAVPDGGRKEVGVGLIGTEIYMTVAASQWVSVVCGSVSVPKLSGSYLDYDPYTSVEIYLPYIGVRTLKADEVIGKTLSVSYAVDILSGACVAWIDIDDHVTYSYMGQCATSIPIVSGDWTNLINGILSVVGSAVGGAVKGGVGGAIAGGVAAAASVAVSDGKISIERSGSISSAGGLLAHPKPFLILSSPRLCKPARQNEFEGYPAYVTRTIGDLSGYTEIEVMHLQGIGATEAELTEIKGLLLGGVIL